MIEYVLGQADVARVRFAQPVLYEVVASLRAVRDQRHLMFGGWLRGAAPRLRGVRLDLLTALVPPGPLVPDYLLADVPGGDIEVELEALREASPAVVRAELDQLRRGGAVPSPLRPLYDDPARHLPAVADELRRYWQAAIEPLWPRIRAVGLADIGYRLDRFASGGVAQLLSGLNPDVAFDGDTITVRRAGTARGLLDGRGVVLVPSVFVWPGVLCSGPAARQTVICYAPRGVADVGAGPSGAGAPGRPDSLTAVVGRTRARLLAALDLPATTTQLAARLAVTPSAVSQHLKILKESALVDSRRTGRVVLYQRTPAATDLLAAQAER
jgi:DNA-binding transcriptional ArsR family regulator